MGIQRWKLVIHGGAGVITRANLDGQKENEFREALTAALDEGARLLQAGATAVDAVCAAVCVLEDSPLFNAGKGSVFTAEEKIEMDAALMEGLHRQAGALCGVQGIRNPVLAARKLMENPDLLMLNGTAAEEFAKNHGIELEDSSYFATAHRREQLEEARQASRMQLDHSDKFGTVGAVALDSYGNTAAATSTGGMTNKHPGRIGDSPIIGAGTYADNRSIAVSATGQGESFIRAVAAFRMAMLVEQLNMDLDQAARLVLEQVTQLGGSGGLIAVDSSGRHCMEFNTEGMFRGLIDSAGGAKVEIYR